MYADGFSGIYQHTAVAYKNLPFFSSHNIRNVLTIIGWIAWKFGSNIHVPLGMNCNVFKLWYHQVKFLISPKPTFCLVLVSNY